MTETAAMSDVERLIALEEIRMLKARRIRALDTQDWETYEALHAPDHVSHNEGEQEWVGAKANTERVARMNREMGIVSVHHAHTPEIKLLSPTEATGVWAMEDNLYWKQGEEEHWLRGFGFYHESYEKRDGRWVFTRRNLRRIKVMLSPGAEIAHYREPRGE